MITALLSTQYMFWLYIYWTSMDLSQELFNSELAKVSSLVINIAFCLTGIVYVLIAYYLKSEWRTLVTIQAFIRAGCSVVLI